MDPLKEPTLPNEERFFTITNSIEAGLYLIGDSGTDYAYEFYETEITRRFSLISQDISKVGPSNVVAYALVKQGIIKQGGPADIFGRQFAIPEDFDPNVDNPYAFENMVCENWAFGGEIGSEDYNPFYPDGICLDTPANISGTEAVACENGDCPTLEDVYVLDEVTGEYDFDLGSYDRVIEWDQVDDPVTGTLMTQSWHNPFDIAKGHRGFLDGDFLMVLYAWSPNYKENAVGHDHYNLYVRRSFDGGYTWTTLPENFTASDGLNYTGDGTRTCENFGWATAGGVYQGCTDYLAGEFEKSRNVSHLVGSQDTILDPRYTPTKGITTQCMHEGVLEDCNGEEVDALPYTEDSIRNPSRYFLVYETGDNTTVMDGEATPQDLFYSRATNFGDDYDVTLEYRDTFGVEVETWDWLEHGEDESGEASITTNAWGTFLYAVWNQALEIGEEEFTDMDCYFRRVAYLEEFLPTASIASVSALKQFEEDDLTIVGSAKDGDYIGGLPEESIVEYEWTHTAEGMTPSVAVGDSETLSIPGGSLAFGMHTFSFRAKDNEGNWSESVSVTIDVRKKHFLFLPLWFGPLQ
jgi:hypothetical protein